MAQSPETASTPRSGHASNATGAGTVLQQSPLTRVEATDLFTYSIKLDKSGEGQRLGMGIDIAGECLVVTGILHDGVVYEWNQANPELEVKVGHLILKVNDVIGHGEALRQECKVSNILEIELARAAEDAERAVNLERRRAEEHEKLREIAARKIQKAARGLFKRRRGFLPGADEIGQPMTDLDMEDVGELQHEVLRLRQEVEQKDNALERNAEHIAQADEELEAKSQLVDAMKRDLMNANRELQVANFHVQQLQDQWEREHGEKAKTEMDVSTEHMLRAQHDEMQTKILDQSQELDELREHIRSLQSEVRTQDRALQDAEVLLSSRRSMLEKSALEQGALNFKLDGQASQLQDQRQHYELLLADLGRQLNEKRREADDLRAELSGLQFNRSPRTGTSGWSDTLGGQLSESLQEVPEHDELFDASTCSPPSTTREGRIFDPRRGKASPRKVTLTDYAKAREELSNLRERLAEKEKEIENLRRGGTLEAKLGSLGNQELEKKLKGALAERDASQEEAREAKEQLDAMRRKCAKTELLLKDKHERELLNCRMAVAEAKRRIALADDRTQLALEEARNAAHPHVIVYDVLGGNGSVRRVVQIRLPSSEDEFENAQEAKDKVSHLVVPITGGGIKVHLAKGAQGAEMTRKLQLRAEYWPDEDTLGEPPSPEETRPPTIPSPSKALGQDFKLLGMFTPISLVDSTINFEQQNSILAQKCYKVIQPFDHSSTIDGLWEWQYCPPDGAWTLKRNWGVREGVLICELQQPPKAPISPEGLPMYRVQQRRTSTGSNSSSCAGMTAGSTARSASRSQQRVRKPLVKEFLRACQSPSPATPASRGIREKRGENQPRSASLRQRPSVSQQQQGTASSESERRKSATAAATSGSIVDAASAAIAASAQQGRGKASSEYEVWSEEGSVMSFSSKSPGKFMSRNLSNINIGPSSGGISMGLPKLGDQVIVSEKLLLDRGAQLGTVRFLGETAFAQGIWVGVALHNNVGKNDGCVDGLRYFECDADHGLFVRPKMCIPLDVSILLDSMQEYLEHEGLDLADFFLEFSTLHSKRDDRLNALELSEMFETAGFSLPLEASQLVIAALDCDDDGELSLAELHAALTARRRGQSFRTPSMEDRRRRRRAFEEAHSATENTSSYVQQSGVGGGGGRRKPVEWVDRRQNARE
mmetsp:Transcript_44031/g.94897  ORF Transcript_44031/g.94897 Transcript_44031/m.94897 type:complete len:1170 (-) Transcript_44031:231-3740(-)